MNAKLTSIGLALCALATVSLAPAEARNNNQQALLSQIAMNNYLAANNANLAAQAQAQATAYNPLQATLASYNQPYGYGGGGGCDRDGDDGFRGHHGRGNGWGNGWGNNGYNGYNNYNNGVVGNLFNGFGNNGISVAQKIANIQNRLSAGNLSSGQVNKLENKLAQLQGQAGVTGYAPYGYNGNNYGNGYVNGVRRFLGI